MSFKAWAVGFLVALLLAPLTLGLSIYLYFVALTLNFVLDIYIKAMKFTVGAVIAIITGILKFIAKVFKTPYEIFEILMKQGMYNAKRRHGPPPEEEEESDRNVVFSTFGSAFSAITTYKLRYVALLLFFIYFTNFPQMLMTIFVDPSQMDLGWLIDILPTLIFVVPIPFVATIVVSALSFEFMGPGKKFWKANALQDAKSLGAGGAAAAGAAVGAAGAAAKGAGEAAAEAGRAGMEAKEMGETAVTTASHLDTAGGMMGGEAAAGEAAAEGAAAEGMLAESVVGGLVGGSAAAVLAAGVLALIIYGLIVAFISLFLVALTWAWIVQLLPMVGGFIMPILGLGNAYAQWFGQSTANVAGPQLGGMFKEEVRMVQHMGAKVGCALKGPQCLRQWRLNNTVRPGSEERGETYELRIEQFGLAQSRVDVAYKEKGYALPINFLVYNTRHGLKGIKAKDVSYKVMVEDASKQGGNAYCTTGWQDIQTQRSGNYILPGLGVSPNRTLAKINLSGCGLLQPSMGVNRVLTMELRYDYSSQATLYFDAMSRKYRREKQIMPEFKKSKTAKTPVQSYINIKAPVTYYSTEGGGRRAVPFPARFGFQTPGFSVDYHVYPNTIKIDDSVLTEHADNCNGLNHQSGNNYQISTRAKNRINDRQTAQRWFQRKVNPAPLRCTFKLTDEAVETINPTGEQLIFRIDANYTVKREQEYSSFSVVNTRCSRVNCPMLVTESYNRTHDGLMYSKCTMSTSVDSRGGCAIIDPAADSGRGSDDIDWTNPVLADDVTIRQGETAYNWNELKGELTSSSIYNDSSIDMLGLKKEIAEKMKADRNGVVTIYRGRSRWRKLDRIWCTNNGEGISEFAEAYASRIREGTRILYFNPKEETCSAPNQGGIVDAVGDFLTLSGDPTFSDIESYCEAEENGGAQSSLVVKYSGGQLACYHKGNN